MPSLQNLGIIHIAFINNHFSLIILDPISVHSVSSVVNPPRTTSKKPSRLRIFVLNPTRANLPNLLVLFSVDFRAIPWPTPSVRNFSILNSPSVNEKSQPAFSANWLLIRIDEQDELRLLANDQIIRRAFRP
jgi:hypothetical protein